MQVVVKPCKYICNRKGVLIINKKVKTILKPCRIKRLNSDHNFLNSSCRGSRIRICDTRPAKQVQYSEEHRGIKHHITENLKL